MSINRTQNIVRIHYIRGTQDRFETTRPTCMSSRSVLHETKAETQTETETKKVVSRLRWSRDLNIRVCMVKECAML